MNDESQPNRRAFLTGKSALDSVRKRTNRLVDESLDLPLGADPYQSLDRRLTYLEQYSKKAMACQFEVSFNMHQYSQGAAGSMAAFELLDQLEDQLTIFRPQSEVSRLNQNATCQPVVVEGQLFQLLMLAVQIHQDTRGAFDITAGPLTKAWGFESRKGQLPESVTIQEILERVGSENLILDQPNQTVQFSKPGVAINLGGIGKGHALDRVGSLLESMEIKDFVFHGGQSSVLARGQSTSDDQFNSDEPDTRKLAGWIVGLSHPTLPDIRLAEIYLQNQALGTSGTGRQGFFYQGKRYGHIIDPRTGWPASQFLSTTVISSSAARSDALATAFFVMDREEIESYCDGNPDVSAIIVVKNQRSKNQVDLVTFNLSDDDWKRLG